MIYEALSCLMEEMNTYFRDRLKADEKVILSSIMNQDGTVAIQGENKVVITLINVEKEPVAKNNPVMGRSSENSSPPVSINLYLLFSAYFSANNYSEALRFISYVIGFLQKKNVFTASNTPKLDSAIEKLSFEIESPGAEKLNNIWATLGAKYMPSVVCKMRMLTYDDQHIREYRPAISATEENGKAVSNGQ
jgi:hypothetical protein